MNDDTKQIESLGEREPGDNPRRGDTLPRIKVRPFGGAVKRDSGQFIDEELSDLYDPEYHIRQFTKNVEDYGRLWNVPVANKNHSQWYDPAAPHRVQVIEMERTGKTWKRTLKEHRIKSAKALLELTETQEYRRSRFYEATGSWLQRVSDKDWKRHVSEAVDPRAFGDGEGARLRSLREVSDPFAFGEPGDGSGSPGSNQAMADIDQEWVPISGGAFQRQLYLHAHWEQTAKAFYEKNHSELAKSALLITTDFVLGRGIAWKIRNDDVRVVWEEFWQRNTMDERMRQLSTDLCLDGDTRIACLDGTHPTIEELASREVSVDNPLWVYSYDHESGRVVPGRAVRCFKQPTEKRCVTVTLDNGEEITASYDHPFLMRDGRYVWAEHLTAGDSLMPLYRKVKNGKYEKVYHPDARGQRWQVTHQAVAGFSNEADQRGRGVSIHHRNENKRDNRPINLELLSTREHFGNHTRERWADPSRRAQFEKTFTDIRSTPEGRETQRQNALKLWADEDRKEAVIESIRQSYQTPEVKERHSRAISKTWADPTVRARRIAGMRARGAQRKAEKLNHKVVSVTPAGSRPVYDLSVERYHNFAVAAGVFTHNSWQGQLLVRKYEQPKGFLCIRSMDPGGFMDIITEPADVETVFFYYYSSPSPYNLGYSNFRGRPLHIPTQRYIIEQYPPNEIFHLKLNVAAVEKWGRSDFYASFGTLKRHRDWTNAATLKDLLQSNLIWKIKLTGDDSDVQGFVSDPNNATLPGFGGTWVENEALTLEALHQDVSQGGGRMGQGSTGAFLTALFAAGQQMPATYFNVSGTGPARATALVQGEPFVKKVATRQQVLRRLLDHLYQEVMERAINAGRLDYRSLRGEDADPEWIFPSTYEEDRGAKLQDVNFAKEQKAISHRTQAGIFAQELGLAEYNYEEELAQIQREQEGSLGELLNPVPEFAPDGQPDGTSGKPPSAGRSQDINGADKKAAFRKQQTNRPGMAKAPETKKTPAKESTFIDRRYLEAIKRTGFRGRVKLPGGGETILE